MNIEIIDNAYDNFTLAQKFKKIVKENAKFQKVMILFDISSQNELVNTIFNEIKECCVVNKLKIEGEISEIYNGYKLLIIITSTNAFVKANIRVSEFYSIFLPTDEHILPYFLDETNSFNKKECTLFLKPSNLDVGVYTSIFFNRYYQFLFDLFYTQTSSIEFDFFIGDITQKNILNLLNNQNKKMNFIDIEIIKKTDIDIEDLCLVDYLLISTFNIVIGAIKHNAYELVDVYKSARENYALIDRYYTMANNELFTNLISLNFNKLNSASEKTKQSIFEFLKYFSISNEHIDEIIERVKNYSKTSDGILGYLYLYNVFGT